MIIDYMPPKPDKTKPRWGYYVGAAFIMTGGCVIATVIGSAYAAMALGIIAMMCLIIASGRNQP